MGQNIVVFVVEGLITNILPTNEATLPTFTCSASSNHENIIHEMTINADQPQIFCPPKITRYTVYRINITIKTLIADNN